MFTAHGGGKLMTWLVKPVPLDGRWRAEKTEPLGGGGDGDETFLGFSCGAGHSNDGYF